jgi:hypothetical protein
MMDGVSPSTWLTMAAAPWLMKARYPVPCPSFDGNSATLYGGDGESRRRILTEILNVESTAPEEK